jgi:hypothetical protein
MHPSVSQPTLETLLHKHCIEQVLYRYCRGCDRAEEALLRDCFHPDATHRHGAFAGSSADFCTFALAIVGKLRACKHTISNVMVQQDGDLALSECHYHSYHRRLDETTGEEEDYFGAGRYLDRFERRGGVWKITARIGLIDFERFEAPTDRTLSSMTPAQRGAKFPDDALYHAIISRRAEP